MAMINAESGTQAHVQAAIDLASTGDTVFVPADDKTWTTTATITGKNITLQGAGSGSSIIRAATNIKVIYIADGSSRVTGFGFNSGYVQPRGVGWRIDHCTFTSTGLVYAIWAISNPTVGTRCTGLIDNCSFINGRIIVVGYRERYWTSYLWSLASPIGTANAVYVEDCTWNNTYNGITNCMDSNDGASYVFRHNTVVDSYIESHYIQDDHRGTRSWEIYDNTFTNSDEGYALIQWCFMRGGTGVIYNNTAIGYNTGTINFDMRRIIESDREMYEALPCGMCEGESTWDENDDASGWWARDQVGTGIDSSQWTEGDVPPSQACDPAYCWDNTHDGVASEPIGINGSDTNIIKPNRDYYSGTAKPGYTPYAYPHPLQGEVSGPKFVLVFHQGG